MEQNQALPQFDDSSYIWLETLSSAQSYSSHLVYDKKKADFQTVLIYKSPDPQFFSAIPIQKEWQSRIKDIKTPEHRNNDLLLDFVGVSKRNDEVFVLYEPFQGTFVDTLKGGKVYSDDELLYILKTIMDTIAVLESIGIGIKDFTADNFVLVDNGSKLEPNFSYKPLRLLEKDIYAKNYKSTDDIPALGNMFLQLRRLASMPESLNEFNGDELLFQIMTGITSPNEKRWTYQTLKRFFYDNQIRIKNAIKAPLEEDVYLLRNRTFYGEGEQNYEEVFKRNWEFYQKYYKSLCKMKTAQAYLEVSWAALQKIPGPVDKVKEITCLYAFGETVFGNGKLTEAEEWFHKVIDKSNLLDEGQKELKRKMSVGAHRYLGTICLHRSQLKKAEEYYDLAMRIASEGAGEDDPEVASCLNRLGIIENTKGNFNKALELMQKALDIRLKVFGEKHEDVAGSYNNLGQLAFICGNLAVATDYYKKAIDINSELYGLKFLNVADTYNNLSLVYEAQMDWNTSDKCLRLAMNIKLWCLKEKYHFQIGALTTNVGFLNESIGIHSRAELDYFRALEIFEKIGFSNTADVADIYNNLGGLHENIEDYEKRLKCEEYYLKALEIRTAIFGEHLLVANSLSSLGVYYKAMSRHDKSIEYHQKSLEMKKKLFGPDNLQVAQQLHYLSQEYFLLRKQKEAFDHETEVLRIVKNILGPEHAQTKYHEQMVNKFTVR